MSYRGDLTNPPNLWWSAELQAEGGGSLDGLIDGNTDGLFCFQLREWARLASLPADAVELVPLGAVLRAAADKLDAQAAAHGEAIHDYTDLLRVWADDAERWESGS